MNKLKKKELKNSTKYSLKNDRKNKKIENLIKKNK
jgi:hypothetical protein